MSFVLSRREVLKLAAAAGLGAVGLGAITADRHTAAASEPQWRVTGPTVSPLAGFDTMMHDFMQARSIPCGALAITHNSRLVFARGYTWSADSALIVEPDSLFRIASISKPITATAVMRLMQDGKLALSEKLTDLLALAPAPGSTPDSRLKNITVLHLLQHLGGWDRAISPDPMFHDIPIAQTLGVSLPITLPHIMTYMTGLTLEHTPGTVHAYSNYGYALLGRIIEAVTGKTYEEYVKTTVLAPLNITGMQIGRSLPQFRHPREVPYVDQGQYVTVFDNSGAAVPASDGAFNLENMDSHGGWIASAVDLVRFASAFDTPEASPILHASSIETMFAPPQIGPFGDGSYYSAGWAVRPVAGGRNTWHNGGLPGTSTLMVRRADGLNWAVLFNQRNDPSGLDYGMIDGLLHQVANTITDWPDHDLFSTFLPLPTATPTNTTTPEPSATATATATPPVETTVTATSPVVPTATTTPTPTLGPGLQPTAGIYLPVVQKP